MKQEGRTELELTESYCFLYPDKSKVGPPRAQLSLHPQPRWSCDGAAEPVLIRGLTSVCLPCLQLQWICEKGLTVGHSRITTLGNPAMGEWLVLWTCRQTGPMWTDRDVVRRLCNGVYVEGRDFPPQLCCFAIAISKKLWWCTCPASPFNLVAQILSRSTR